MGKKEHNNLAELDPVTGRILETPELRAHGLAEMRKLITASGKRFPRTDDQFLLAFLRCRKYDIQRSFDVAASFAAWWYKHASLIEGLTVDDARPFINLKMTQPLRGKDKQGNRVQALYMNVDLMEMAKFQKEQLKATVLLLAGLFGDEELQLQGLTIVESFKGFSMFRAMRAQKAMDTPEMKEMMGSAMNTFPFRIRNIYVTHTPWYFTAFFAVAKLFFKSKIVKRVKLYGSDVHKVHEHIDKSVLPAEFGGTCTDEFDAFFRDMEAEVRTTGKLGGFVVPMSVEHPCGAPDAPTA